MIESIKDLQKDDNILIPPADTRKGRATVIYDKKE